MNEPLITDITPEEWKAAENYFRKNRNQKKLSHQSKLVNHTFIKVGKEIYAIKRKECLGEGAFGIVKVVQNKKGENFAVKIEGIAPGSKISLRERITHAFRRKTLEESSEVEQRKFTKKLKHSEKKVMKTLKETKGSIKVTYATPKIWRKKTKKPKIKGKIYSIQTLKGGQELKKLLPEKSNSRYNPNTALSGSQKLRAGLKACENISYLHQQGILHGDIKAANFMADVKGHHMVVSAIDFGFSMKLKKGQNEKKLKHAIGSPFYMAPEIRGKCIYSRQSDIYALGKMLKTDLGINDPLIEKMMAVDPKKRASLEEVIPFLRTQLILKLKEESSIVASPRSPSQTIQPNPALLTSFQQQRDKLKSTLDNPSKDAPTDAMKSTKRNSLS